MNTENREKFIHEFETKDEEFVTQKPFKLDHDEKRSFVRIEISNLLTLNTIKGVDGKLSHNGDGQMIQGSILNVSAGGLLADLDQMVMTGDIVSIRFIIQENLELKNVLGLIKRCESDGEGVIAGIEFLSEKRLEDIFSAPELELIGDSFTNFDSGIKKLLHNYVKRTTDQD